MSYRYGSASKQFIHTSDAPMSESDHGDPDELRANAELIAAAPELLAALKGLLHMPEFDGYATTSAARKQAKRRARAAITKAGG